MNLNLVCYSLLLLTAVGSALLPYPLAMWFLLSSLLTWLIYGADKLAARKAWRRVPETTLLVLGLAGALPDALKGSFKTAGIVVAAAGAVLAIGGFCVQVMGVGGMENALVSGADLVADVTIYLAVAVASLVLAAAGTVAALLGKSPVAMAGFGAVMAVIGIFVARLVFYAVQLSVGLSF